MFHGYVSLQECIYIYSEKPAWGFPNYSQRKKREPGNLDANIILPSAASTSVCSFNKQVYQAHMRRMGLDYLPTFSRWKMATLKLFNGLVHILYIEQMGRHWKLFPVAHNFSPKVSGTKIVGYFGGGFSSLAIYMCMGTSNLGTWNV